MNSNRLEAFSDGVMAIILTIMVLALNVPKGDDLDALEPLFPVFLSYILSFIFIGIYWNNHHHMLQATQRVSGKVLWANLHLLFWLSLIPFVTGWMGQNHFASLPTAFYGFVLFMCAISYTMLQNMIARSGDGENEELRKAIGKDRKGKISLVIYLAAIILAFVNQWISDVLYVLVAAMWLIPDRRIEDRLAEQDEKERHDTSR